MCRWFRMRDNPCCKRISLPVCSLAGCWMWKTRESVRSPTSSATEKGTSLIPGRMLEQYCSVAAISSLLIRKRVITISRSLYSLLIEGDWNLRFQSGPVPNSITRLRIIWSTSATRGLSEWRAQRRVGISDYYIESSPPLEAKNSPDAEYEWRE